MPQTMIPKQNPCCFKTPRSFPVFNMFATMWHAQANPHISAWWNQLPSLACVWAFVGWIFGGFSWNYRIISPNLNKRNKLKSEVVLIWAMNYPLVLCVKNYSALLHPNKYTLYNSLWGPPIKFPRITRSLPGVTRSCSCIFLVICWT